MSLIREQEFSEHKSQSLTTQLTHFFPGKSKKIYLHMKEDLEWLKLSNILEAVKCIFTAEVEQLCNCILVSDGPKNILIDKFLSIHLKCTWIF